MIINFIYKIILTKHVITKKALFCLIWLFVNKFFKNSVGPWAPLGGIPYWSLCRKISEVYWRDMSFWKEQISSDGKYSEYFFQNSILNTFLSIQNWILFTKVFTIWIFFILKVFRILCINGTGLKYINLYLGTYKLPRLINVSLG